MPVVFVAASKLPTPFATFTMHGFLDEATGREHVVLSLGDIADGQPVLGRLHSECLTGDALFSQRCDCGSQLEAALQAIAREGRGVLLYLRQEGRGIGLLNKIRAYELQDGGADTVEANERLGFAADQRDYAICLPMLEHLGVKSLRLMTNNPRKVKALTDMNIVVAERVPLHTGHNPHNRYYLATKAGKLGHMLGNEHQGEVPPGVTRAEVKRRLALAWWQYLAVGLVPLPVMAWAFGGGDALIPVLAMPLFIAGAATMFLSLPRFGAYKRALIATSKVLGTGEEAAAWIELARVRRMAMLYACFPAWVAALSVLVGLEAVPQILLALSTVVVLYLYRIPRQLG